MHLIPTSYGVGLSVRGFRGRSVAGSHPPLCVHNVHVVVTPAGVLDLNRCFFGLHTAHLPVNGRQRQANTTQKLHVHSYIRRHNPTVILFPCIQHQSDQCST